MTRLSNIERLEPRTTPCGSVLPAAAFDWPRPPDTADAPGAIHQPVSHEAVSHEAVSYEAVSHEAHGPGDRDRAPADGGRRVRRAPRAPRPRPSMTAENLTTPTLCAEEDNVNVPMSLPRAAARVSFTIEARHPGYAIGDDSRDADFTNCPPAEGVAVGPQESIPVFDDHASEALIAVRDPNFHQPGMQVRVGATAVNDVHFIRLIRRIDGSNSWPEVLVLYSDGNLRVKPQAPVEGGDPRFGGDPVFGSSVVVGAAPRSARPTVNIRTVVYDPSRHSLRVWYAGGGKATLRVLRADPFATRVQVIGRYATSPDLPFATLRSMFVADGNCDVDDVVWIDKAGAWRDEPITAFRAGEGREFLFRRAGRSRHNTSAPDVWIGELKYRGR